MPSEHARRPGGRASVVTAAAVLACVVLSYVQNSAQSLVYVPFGNATRVFTTANGTLVPGVLISANVTAVTVRGDEAFAYLPSGSANAVEVVDTATNAITQTAAAGANPSRVAVSPDGLHAYVTNTGGDSISVYSVDPMTGQLTSAATIPLGAGAGPLGIVVTPDGSRVYAVLDGFAGQVAVIDTSNNTVLTTVPLGSDPREAAVNPSGTRVYVTDATDDTVTVINTSNDMIVATPALSPGSGPTGIVMSPDGAYYYTANGNATISQFDASSDTLVTPDVSTVSAVVDVAIKPDGVYLYAAESGSVIQVFSITPGTGVLQLAGNRSSPRQLDIALATNGNAMLATGATFLAKRASALDSTGSGGAVFTGGTLAMGAASLSLSTAMTLKSQGGTVDTNSNDATISSVIGGSGGLTKAGLGTLTLSGPNTYSGATTVTGGTLLVNGSIGSSAVTVANTATLGGTGTAGAVTVNSGGTLSPGTSPGILNTGNLSLASGSTYAVEISGTTAGEFDQTAVTGTVSLGGATLTVTPSVSSVGQPLTIIDNDSSDAITGTFNGLVEGSAITGGGHKYQISYVGGTGNDVTLTEKLDQTISFSSLADKTFNDPSFDVSAIASASSGLTVAFSSTTTGVCTVTGTTVTLVAAGTCTIAANQSGSGSYFAAPQVPQSFNVAKASQAITFTPLGNKTFGDPAFMVSATASSNLTVAFSSSTTGVCTVSGTTVTIVSAGTCTIAADQAGNGNYGAATQVPHSFTVSKASQTITFNALGNKTFGAAPFGVGASASSGLSVTFASTTTSVCTVSGTTVTLVVVGQCTIAADQAGSANYNAAPQVTQSFAVNAASQPRMSLDVPQTSAVVPALTPMVLAGWALDVGAGAGVGVSNVHLWAYPIVNGLLGTPVFLGAAALNLSRPDVGALYGSQFTSSGWSLTAAGLPAGQYLIAAQAQSTVTGTFNDLQTAVVTSQATGADPVVTVDAPHVFATVGPTLLVTGWTVDAGASSGTGVDVVHVWAYPYAGGVLGTPVFLGAASLGFGRSDVAAIFGAQFAPSGYTLQSSALAPRTYRLLVFAHSTVSGLFNSSSFVDFTVTAAATPNPWMALENPSAGSTQQQPFLTTGWALDFGAAVGPGVDMIHVWATRVSDGAQTFLGAASYGSSRSDVAAIFGSSFGASGYSLSVSGLASGTYDITVFARSTVTGTFNQMQTVRVGVQ